MGATLRQTSTVTPSPRWRARVTAIAAAFALTTAAHAQTNAPAVADPTVASWGLVQALVAEAKTQRREGQPLVSLLLALLRKKLAEFDAGGEATRLIMSRDEIVELLRVFLPDSSNEAKLIDQVDTQLNKIVELGFLRRLKSNAAVNAGNPAIFVVRRILKAFVDAQWLAEFDARLANYQAQLAGQSEENNEA